MSTEVTIIDPKEYQIEESKANETTLEISKKFNSFKSWAKSEIEKL